MCVVGSVVVLGYVEYEPKSSWISQATSQLLKLDQEFFLARIYSCVEFLHSRSQFINRKFWCNGCDSDTEDEGDTEIAASIMVKDEEAKLPTISGKRNAWIFCPMSNPAIHPNHPSLQRPWCLSLILCPPSEFCSNIFVVKYLKYIFLFVTLRNHNPQQIIQESLTLHWTLYL